MAKNKTQDEIGALDRRIVIQRNSPSIATSGQRVNVWSNFATVWASWSPTITPESQEKFESDSERHIQKGVFKIRYLRINTKYRIFWDGRYWDIVNIQEDGRFQFSLITVQSRDIIT